MDISQLAKTKVVYHGNTIHRVSVSDKKVEVSFRGERDDMPKNLSCLCKSLITGFEQIGIGLAIGESDKKDDFGGGAIVYENRERYYLGFCDTAVFLARCETHDRRYTGKAMITIHNDVGFALHKPGNLLEAIGIYVGRIKDAADKKR